MYEIWLVLNIVCEIALSLWPQLALALGVWLLMLWAARAKLGGATGRSALALGLALGAVLAVVLFFTVPGLTHSSLSSMGYWVDWANLLAVALGLGVLAAGFAWPLLALLLRKRPAGRMV